MNLLVFDQTLASTGWVRVQSSSLGLQLLGSGTITTPANDQGHMGNLRRTIQLYEQVLELVSSGHPMPDYLVHELPPVGRPGIQRPESSLLGGAAVHLVGYHRGIPVTAVSAQKAKRTLTGFANANKSAVKAAIAEKWPDLELPNEHVRDAWALAWQYHIERAG